MKEIIGHKKIIIGLLVLGTLIAGSTALAALVDWPPSPLGTVLDPSGEKTGEPSTLPILVKYLYEWAVGLGGLAAFIALIIAGFDYLTSTGDPAKMNSAKDRIIWAIGGLALLLGSWVILNIINPQLTTLHLPPLDFSERAKELTGCRTSADCTSGSGNLDCVCVAPEEIVGQKGVAGKECEVGYCSALGMSMVQPIEHTCDRIEIGVWQPDPAGGGSLLAFSLTTKIECKNISDLPFNRRAFRGGGIIYTRGYKKTSWGEEACGTNYAGEWSPVCQECQQTANPDACDKCCGSCLGRIVFYQEQRCIKELMTINAGANYVDLSEDVYSIKFLPAAAY